MMKKRRIALQIEWLWLRIHALERKLKRTQSEEKRCQIQRKIRQKRYEEEQLRCLYEVLCGIRDEYGRVA